MTVLRRVPSSRVLVLLLASCSGTPSSNTCVGRGVAGNGTNSCASGGMTASGGAASIGGTWASAGSSVTGGNASTGGTTAASGGGLPTTGGAVPTGGAATGGVQATGGSCAATCSSDRRSIVDCSDRVLAACATDQLCDSASNACASACSVAASQKSSAGCEFYATNMDRLVDDACFAVFIANASAAPAHIAVSYDSQDLPVSNFVRVPSGTGVAIFYAPYDVGAGLPPGQAAILFLSGSSAGSPTCPVPSAVPTGSEIFQATGVGHSFHITTDVPVSAYEMNPYGQNSLLPGSSLLLPTSTWGTNYLAVTAAPSDVAPPSLNIVAAQDNTSVTLIPNVRIAGGGALPAGAAGALYSFRLNQGEQAQFTQDADLTGSVIQADKPIGVMAGQGCMEAPSGAQYCDHAEQMLPPISAVGYRYAAVMYRPRLSGDAAIWRMIGLVDGSSFTYSTQVPSAPSVLNAGQNVTFSRADPFFVQSQDSGHPFLLISEMTGSNVLSTPGYGDPEMVLGVPPEQYQTEYHFYADPNYPETNLVLVRAAASGTFADVTLDCSGPVSGWQALGDYEWTRVDLTRHDFQNIGSCSSGYHSISSGAPFGLWVWGWGSPETTLPTTSQSYGYPAGMHVQTLNAVVMTPTPR